MTLVGEWRLPLLSIGTIIDKLKALGLTKTAEKKDEWQGLKIIVGLGNPGKNYELTRHNIGFRVIDRIGITYGASFSPEKHLKAEVCKISIASQPVLLAKPSTYMNLSGLSVGAIASWYKVALEEFLIVHDDVSLPLGRLRFQKGGGAGGQHGIESIIDTFGGAKNFNRLKVGVGPDPGGDRRADFVLSAVPEIDRHLYEEVIERSAQAASSWLGQGIEKTMNLFNNTNLAEPPQAVPAEKNEAE